MRSPSHDDADRDVAEILANLHSLALEMQKELGRLSAAVDAGDRVFPAAIEPTKETPP